MYEQNIGIRISQKGDLVYTTSSLMFIFRQERKPLAEGDITSTVEDTIEPVPIEKGIKLTKEDIRACTVSVKKNFVQ